MGDQNEVPTSEASLNHNIDNTYYSFTMKWIKKDDKIDHEKLYAYMLGMLKKYKAEYCTHSIEHDSLGRLHLHGVFIASRKLRYTSFKVKYLHVYVRRIQSNEDLENWVDYIHKEENESIRSYFTNGENHFLEEASPIETKREDEQK